MTVSVQKYIDVKIKNYTILISVKKKVGQSKSNNSYYRAYN